MVLWTVLETDADPKRTFLPIRNENGVPLPRAEQPRNLFKIEQLNLGEKVIRKIDPDLSILTPEQHQKLVAVENGTAMSQLLALDLGDTLNPDLRRAAEVFGDLGKVGLKMPDVVMSLRFYLMSQIILVTNDAAETLKIPKIKKAERIDAIRLRQQATAELAKAINQVQKLAERLNYIQQIEMPEPEFEPEPVKKVLKVGVAPDLG